MVIAKFICLFLAILYGARCLAGTVVKQGYSGFQAILFAAGLSGFILLQWCI